MIFILFGYSTGIFLFQINVEDKDRTHYLLTIILPIIITLVIVLIGGVAYYAHKKNERDKARDGLEFNPNYMNVR